MALAGRRYRLRADQLGADAGPARRPSRRWPIFWRSRRRPFELDLHRLRRPGRRRARPALRGPEPDRRLHAAGRSPGRPAGTRRKSSSPRSTSTRPARQGNWNAFNQVLRDRRTDVYDEMLGSSASAVGTDHLTPIDHPEKSPHDAIRSLSLAYSSPSAAPVARPGMRRRSDQDRRAGRPVRRQQRRGAVGRAIGTARGRRDQRQRRRARPAACSRSRR